MPGCVARYAKIPATAAIIGLTCKIAIQFTSIYVTYAYVSLPEGIDRNYGTTYLNLPCRPKLEARKFKSPAIPLPTGHVEPLSNNAPIVQLEVMVRIKL